MAIGVYTRYSRLGASSRLRTISAAAGLPGAQLHCLWSDDALRYFYRTGYMLRVGNFLCKGPDTKYFRLCEP